MAVRVQRREKVAHLLAGRGARARPAQERGELAQVGEIRAARVRRHVALVAQVDGVGVELALRRGSLRSCARSCRPGAVSAA